MFNLKSQLHNKKLINSISLNDLLKDELHIHDIIHKNNHYEILVGDEQFVVNSLDQCKNHLQNGIQELKSTLFDVWGSLKELSSRIVSGAGYNNSSLDNILFIHNVKKTLTFSLMFDQLSDVSEIIRQLLNLDIIHIDTADIVAFNSLFTKIRLLHVLIMSEIYKIKLLDQYASLTKNAQISGPWANLDLPMQERIWPYAEDEEYFHERAKARRAQTRYNPESVEMAGSNGYYFIWNDQTRGPYRFEQISTESPYKHRNLLSIP